MDAGSRPRARAQTVFSRLVASTRAGPGTRCRRHQAADGGGLMAETAKEAILARIRAALATAPEATSPPRTYLQRDERDPSAMLAELVERLRDYKALVERVGPEDLPGAIAAACARHGIGTLVVPADVPTAWLPQAVVALRDDP